MAQPSDVNVDDLRRRARRRLVGAIVLALSAAVFVPMLLESEPKPLGEDVSVKIPPVDNGKFVNKLNPKGGGDAAKAPAKAEPARVEAPKPEMAKPAPMQTESALTSPPGRASGGAPATSSSNAVVPAPADPAAVPPKRLLAEAEQKVLSPSPKAPTVVAPPAGKVAAPSAATALPAPATTVEAPQSEPMKSAPANADAAKDPVKPAADISGFSVQLAAFSDDKGANSLANKLKKAGYAAYTEPLTTTSGTKLWRVRVGPFATRDAAGAVRDKLKGDGYIGIVAPSR